MNTVCPFCATRNRVPENRLDHNAKCGRCAQPLFDGNVINARADNLDKLLKDELPIVIDFWAPWCAPCLSFAPNFESAAKARSGKFRFLKVNTETEPTLSTRFKIRSIPTLIVFKHGEEVDKQSGTLPKAVFDEWLDKNS